VDALAKCLSDLMNNPTLANDLGQLGYMRAMSQYTNIAMAKQQLEFFRELL
jgi:enoyl-[acyl-carrier-protein] reductase (NADH)